MLTGEVSVAKLPPAFHYPSYQPQPEARRSEGREAPRREIRTLFDNGERREGVAALLNVDRTTLYRALIV
jgi:DNA invertase Pin-like site-specific DNA recombinase